MDNKDQPSKIMIVPPKTVSKSNKAKLSEQGFIVIECDDPAKIVTLSFTPLISPDALTMAALKTLANSNWEATKAAFVVNLYNQLQTPQP